MIKIKRRSLLVGAACVLVPRTGLTQTHAKELPKAIRDKGQSWKLVFEDDFSVPSIFQRQWRKVRDAGGGHDSSRIPENVTQEDGVLNLNIQRSDGEKRDWTAGYVMAREFKTTYGYYECEMKIPAEAGVNNAFWLTSTNQEDDNLNFELDVAEVKYPNAVQVSARRSRPQRMVYSTTWKSATDLSQDYHTYGMLWLKERISFFVDDLKVFDIENNVAHSDGVIRFSNAVGGNFGETDGDVVGSTQVRSVKVYSLS